MSNTLTLEPAQLKRLLTAVTPFADKTGFIPVFNAVLLESHEGVVTATATDRYQAGVAKVSVPDVEPGFSALIPLKHCAELLKFYPPSRKLFDVHPVTLTTDGIDLTAHQADVIPELTAKFPLAGGDFPKSVRDVISREFASEGTGDPVLVDSSRLGSFKHLGDSVEIKSHGKGPVLVVADGFVGVLMSMNRPSGEPTKLEKTRSEWDFLFAPKPVEAVA